MPLKPIKLYFIAGLIVGVAASAGLLSLWQTGAKPSVKPDLTKYSAPNATKPNCATEEKELTINGNSLEPLIKDGTVVKAMANYFACHEVKRNDVVVFYYAGRSNPLVKIVRGIPGDTFDFKAVAGGWNIILNKNILENSAKKPYVIPDVAQRMLSLYAADYKGVIPDGGYLILGDNPSASLDSGSFGLAGKTDLLGKIER